MNPSFFSTRRAGARGRAGSTNVCGTATSAGPTAAAAFIKVGRDRWARRWIREALSSFAAGPAVPPYLKAFLSSRLAISSRRAGPTLATSLTIFLSVALSLVLTGCGESHASIHAHTEPASASTYKAGHGLQLSPTASQFIGLKTIAVSTRDVLEAKAATAIPAEALLRTIKGDFVFVANGAWYLRTPVQIGATDGAWFEVKDGLYEGDTIVTHGTQALWLAELQAVNGGVGCADGH